MPEGMGVDLWNTRFLGPAINFSQWFLAVIRNNFPESFRLPMRSFNLP